MTSPTPGKWTTRGHESGLFIYDENGGHIGMAYVDDHPIAEAQANARLIADAPETKAQRDELLAAAKALLETITHGAINGTIEFAALHGMTKPDPATVNAIAGAHVAIARAEGKVR